MIRVIGVGDNFVDRYLYKNTMYPGGNSVNFAVYARLLGCESAYCGVLAQDRQAQMICSALDAYGIDHSKCPVLPDGETGTGSIRLVNGDRVITDDNDNGSVKHTPLELTEALLGYISGFDGIHSAYFGFLAPQLERLASTGVPIAYDFAEEWDDALLAELCPHVTIALLSGGDRDDCEIRRILALACAHGCEVAICTIGSRGAIAYDGSTYYEKAPYNCGRPVVDTMGAGDSFLTGFTVSYLDGRKRLASLAESLDENFLGAGDLRDYREHLIRLSMCCANAMAMRTCMTNGSFGRGEPIDTAEKI